MIDLALFIKECRALIISDTHLGYESEFNNKGMMIPRFSLLKMKKRIESIIKKTNPNTIIINGDIKHNFGKVDNLEWRDTLRFFKLLKENSKELILIKGNHDKIIEPIAKKHNIKIKEYLKIDDTLITHGDKIKEIDNYNTIIIGHEHPAINIKENNRKEKFKCFFKGKYKDKTLIVQPSFSDMTQGTDILEGKHLSPYLKENIENFDVFIVADKIYPFGKVSSLD